MSNAPCDSSDCCPPCRLSPDTLPDGSFGPESLNSQTIREHTIVGVAGACQALALVTAEQGGSRKTCCFSSVSEVIADAITGCGVGWSNGSWNRQLFRFLHLFWGFISKQLNLNFQLSRTILVDIKTLGSSLVTSHTVFCTHLMAPNITPLVWVVVVEWI